MTAEADTTAEHRATTGLSLRFEVASSPRLLALLEREFDAIAATLAPWGRFTQPVRLHVAADLPAVRALAGGPTDGILQAAATAEVVVLLEPSRWPTTPPDPALRTVVTHELAHALLFQRCAPPGRSRPVALPCWFREGMAVLASEGRPDARRRIEAASRTDVARLAHADATAIAGEPDATYDVAVTLFDAWLQLYGMRKLGALCREMRNGRAFAAAFASSCGVEEAEWLTATVRQLHALASDGGTTAPR